MSMTIAQREVRGVIILDLEGRLVMEDGVSQLVEHLNAPSSGSPRRRILLNFDKVTYLDSAGVGAIAWKFATAKRRDVDIKLVNLRRKSHNVLKTTRLLTVLQAYRVGAGSDRQLRRQRRRRRQSDFYLTLVHPQRVDRRHAHAAPSRHARRDRRHRQQRPPS